MALPGLRSPGVKMLILAALSLLLLIPLAIVRGLINERAERAREAEASISAPWGASQQIAAAYLTGEVPFIVATGSGNVTQHETHAALADRLDIDAELSTETRHRGMFSVPVYTASLTVKAAFSAADVAQLRAISDPELPLQLRFAVADAKGVRAISSLSINGKNYRMAAGDNELADLHSLAVALPKELQDQDLKIEINAIIAGTRQIQFLPFARDTRVHAHGRWPDPGFIGAFLPADRKVEADGFEANWQVLEFNRQYPQEFALKSLQQLNLAASAFGVDLYQPANVYQQNERSGKYGLLIIALVFNALFLFEVLGRVLLHPVQYLLVGVVLALFYLLLLAMSEHCGFSLAYGASAGIALLLIGGYARAVLGSLPRAALLAGLQGGAYAVFYVLVVNEDAALLLGSVSLTVVLALVMFLTRRTDWYALGRTAEAQVAT